MRPGIPAEITEEIIDNIAECCPESLPSCALVCHACHPRSIHHIYRIFRTPIITTVDGLRTFADIVKENVRLASLATSLEVAPDPALNLGSTTYIPFHHLSSHALPNVRRLALAETLRWADYPWVYRKIISGPFFDKITALDLSCHVSSVWDLFRIVRSFKNVQDVRLIYPKCIPTGWIGKQPRMPLSGKALSFKLQNLEVSLAVHKPVLEVFGHSVVNLSVICPVLSTVSTGVLGDGRTGFQCSLTLLQTVKIIVAAESSGPIDRSGLQKLPGALLASLTEADVPYSLWVMCEQHNAVRYRMESTTMVDFRQWIRGLAETRINMSECVKCRQSTSSAYDSRCQWGPGRCDVPLEDKSPSGIARHLRQYHDVAVTDNRNRGMCAWGGRCGKDMFPSSFGKHIAELHLRNMTKQCPYCFAQFARADTLSRHIKAFCPHATGRGGGQAPHIQSRG